MDVQISYSFYTKYRRKAIYYKVRSDLIDIIKHLCGCRGVEIIEGHMMPDHVHLLVLIPPQTFDFRFYGVSQEQKCIDDI